MSDTAIKVENVSKLYRLGEVGTGTISHDLNRFFARIRGKEDPFAKIGQVNDRTKAAGKDEHIWALKDIDFEVKQGEVLGIIGKNGAGKSTLLKILSRVTAPTAGEIKIKGRVASLLEVGTGFHPEMTGRENIYMNGTILGMTRKEINSKLDDIVDFAGVAKYLDTPTKRYSSGMQVRLAFAVAAFLEPEILIVDEVLAVGDAEFQKRAIGKMQEVSKGEGRTVLFVSHNMGSLKSLCTRAILLEQGQIVLNGEVHNVISKYISGGEGVVDEGYRDLKELKTNTKALHLLSIKSYDTKKKIRSNFLQSEEVFISLEFDCKEVIKGVRFNLKLLTSDGQIAFMSTSHELTKHGLDIGLHSLDVCIPANLFNSSRYIISLDIGIPGVNVLFNQTSLLSINVEGEGIGGSFFNEKWPGVVCPMLKWNYNKVFKKLE